MDIKPSVFSVGLIPPGSLIAVDRQSQPIVHADDSLGKRKNRAGLTPAFVCHQPL
jgi:hypothetical protein